LIKVFAGAEPIFPQNQHLNRMIFGLISTFSLENGGFMGFLVQTGLE